MKVRFLLFGVALAIVAALGGAGAAAGP